MVVNDIGALLLDSSVEELVNQGHDLSNINQIGEDFLERLLDKHQEPLKAQRSLSTVVG